MKQPSQEKLKEVLYLLLQTSVPRILKEMEEGKKNKKVS